MVGQDVLYDSGGLLPVSYLVLKDGCEYVGNLDL